MSISYIAVGDELMQGLRRSLSDLRVADDGCSAQSDEDPTVRFTQKTREELIEL